MAVGPRENEILDNRQSTPGKGRTFRRSSGGTALRGRLKSREGSRESAADIGAALAPCPTPKSTQRDLFLLFRHPLRSLFTFSLRFCVLRRPVERGGDKLRDDR